MKRKLYLSSVFIPTLLATGAMAQVVNFHAGSNGQLSFPGVGYDELFAGQGAYSDPGNDIWNGFGQYNGYGFGSTFFYSGAPGNYGGPFPQQFGNPGNPYASYGSSATSPGTTAFGTNLFVFPGSPSTTGNATSSGQSTPITLSVAYGSDNGIGNIASFYVPNGSPSFLLGEAAVANGTNSTSTFVMSNVPAGTYGLFVYGANEGNNRGTAFAVSSGTAHNGIAATLNSGVGSPASSFVEGQNFVVFENVTPSGAGTITITATPNPQDGIGNSSLSGEADVNGFQLIFNPKPTALASTAAQNIYTGGTASFSFSPAFATGATFQWQSIIGGVTNNLSDVAGSISGSKTTNLVITGAAAGNVGAYQCVISASTGTNTSPAAPLTLLTSPASGPLQYGDATNFVGYVLKPGDAVVDFNNNFGSPYYTIPADFVMTVTNVEDNTLFQYVNFGGNGGTAPFSGPVAFQVTPSIGSTVVTGIRFFTASSHPEDDPADYLIQGSDDGVDFTNIAGGLLSLPVERNAAGGPINDTNQVLQEVVFPNGTAYTIYQITFTNIADQTGTASNGLQIAEVQLLGSLPASAPLIEQFPDTNETLLVGTAFHPTVVPSGPGPFTYAWTFNSQPIASATNATLTVTNVQLTNDGTYVVTVNSPFGTTNASTILAVVAPTPYQQALLSYNPLGYWPLDESGGPVAFDEVNGYNGTYIGTGIYYQQAGVPFGAFGANSYSADFNNASYVDVPEGPFNITGPITIMAWVLPQPGDNNFQNILGHGDSSYRITVNNGTGSLFPGFNYGGYSNVDATDPTSLSANVWHFVVGVYEGGSGTTPNGILYVDGLEVASNEISSVAGNALDVNIAGAPDYTSRYFVGDIAHAAIIPQALTAGQVAALYDSASPSPTASVPTGPITVDENGNGSITASVLGALPFTYQWFYTVGGTTFAVAGATNQTLQLTDVQTVQGTYDYFVVASNAFGGSTSGVVTLNILTGPPVIVSDISPLFLEVPPGTPVTYSVAASGTEPFHYQWSNGVTAISGATNSTYAFNVAAGTNTLTVGIANVDGSSASSTVAVVGNTNPPPIIAFDNGTNWTLNDAAGDPGFFTNNVLELTDGTGGQSVSAFYNAPQYIEGFLATFTYEAGGNRAADGVTFCLQNASDTTNAVGAGGGSLGLAGITNSAAFEINIYSGDHGGPGITYGTDGNVPDTDPALGNFLNVAPVSITNGPIDIELYYSQGVLNVWLTQATNKFSTKFVTDLPAAVGAETAYMGFTGACGGDNAIQTISNLSFSYSTQPILSVAHETGGSVIVSWPISVAGQFVLQQATSLNSVWTTVVTPPQNVNLENQVTLTPGATPLFFRLSLQ